MKKNHLIFNIVILMLLLALSGCRNKINIDKDSYAYQESIIINYLNNLQIGKIEAAFKNVYIPDEDIKSGYIDVAYDAMKEFECKKYEIKSISKISDKIYLAKVILNTNNNSVDKTIYSDEEFNPYLCFINNRSYIVYSKDKIPNDISDDLSQIPDNY